MRMLIDLSSYGADQYLRASLMSGSLIFVQETVNGFHPYHTTCKSGIKLKGVLNCFFLSDVPIALSVDITDIDFSPSSGSLGLQM